MGREPLLYISTKTRDNNQKVSLFILQETSHVRKKSRVKREIEKNQNNCLSRKIQERTAFADQIDIYCTLFLRICLLCHEKKETEVYGEECKWQDLRWYCYFKLSSFFVWKGISSHRQKLSSTLLKWRNWFSSNVSHVVYLSLALMSDVRHLSDVVSTESSSFFVSQNSRGE
jgi:hypothetical protein